MLRKLLLLIFTLQVSLAHCQLSDHPYINSGLRRSDFSDDSLRKICLAVGIDSEELEKSALSESTVPLALIGVHEIFKNSFKNIKIFVVLYDFVGCHLMHGYEFIPKIYAVDTTRRKPVHFLNAPVFCNFVNAATTKISNLDKAYLYLFLFKKLMQTRRLDEISPIEQYGREISDNSAFQRSKYAHKLFLPEYCRECAIMFNDLNSNKKAASEVEQSTNNRIVIYTDEAISSYYIETRYQFRFDNRSDLVGVNTKIDTLK